MLEKQVKFHHSVTENGNIQVRQVTEYIKDGEVVDRKYSEPYTPKDMNDMTGFDDRSKEIVAAIITPEVKTEFETEKVAHNHPERITKIGVEEAVAFDRVIEPDGKIAVRQITRVFDDGKEVSKKYHRTWVMPGDDPSNADVMSKALAKKLHTPDCIAAYKAELAKNENL